MTHERNPFPSQHSPTNTQPTFTESYNILVATYLSLGSEVEEPAVGVGSSGGEDTAVSDTCLLSQSRQPLWDLHINIPEGSLHQESVHNQLWLLLWLTAEPAARLVVPRVLKKTCAPVQSWRTVSSETESRFSMCWLSLPALSSAATSTPGSSSNLRRDSSVTLPTVSYKNGAVSTI